ncbi:MAG: hypothetical protein FJY75_04135 [Candidatus Eisenbacteria bacterium]|uniref:Uncharacterized protein n=1 Tax=Eiseniibacteriota bacterium TaxID=2212470 RepID=A0A937XBT0_UNCEI|nr:hypothetical protein [Candidatus Eisenbacteria bacterium]
MPAPLAAGRPPRRAGRLAALGRVDRRWIFLLVGASVALPLLRPLHLPIGTSREARAYHAEVERLQPGDEMIFSFDYEPDTMAELDPMSLATLRHAFSRGVRVIALTNYAGGPGIALRILGQAASEHERQYGRDYVFLGYNPDYSATMLRMGESIRSTFPTDHFGTPSAELPLLREVDRYADIELLVTVTASALAEYWVIWAGGRFGQRIVAGNTAIQAVLIYPYYQTGQLAGFLGGLKGAAEYERLIGRDGAGVRGMDAQSVAHLLIVCFIVLGNIGYFAQRRSARAAGDAARDGEA